jgi:hypothetical protein
VHASELEANEPELRMDRVRLEGERLEPGGKGAGVYWRQRVCGRVRGIIEDLEEEP